jgi:hypothetical protein
MTPSHYDWAGHGGAKSSLGSRADSAKLMGITAFRGGRGAGSARVGCGIR